MAKLEEKGFAQRIQRIESLVGAIQGFADPVARASAQELVRAVLDLHGAGLERLLELITADDGAADGLVDRLADDDLVGSLLLLHGLHPLDLETRVRRAVERLRPLLRAESAQVELLGVAEEGVVRLRLGASAGRRATAATLKRSLEEAIYQAAPDARAVDVEDVALPPNLTPTFIPLSALRGDGRGGGAAGATAAPRDEVQQSVAAGGVDGHAH